MNKSLILFLFLILILTQVEIVNAQELPSDSLIQSLINQTNLDTLVHFVNVLSGEDSVTINDSTYLLLSRNAVHPHNDLAADYIFQTLSRFGLPTYNQTYSASGRNVYAIQTGTHFPDQEFILCAHYDDMPVQPPAPGAEDNASGVAAVLETARILSQIQTQFTVIYALWDEEEIGLIIGSPYYATQACQAGDSILGVVNLDGLSWDSNNDGLIDIHTDTIAESIPLAVLIDSLEATYNIGLNPIIYNPGAWNSDHSSFWNQGYTAVGIFEAYWGGDPFPFYHTPNDRIIYFNLNYFHKLSKLAVATIAYLSLHDYLTNVEEREYVSLSNFLLAQNYPNPFNPTTVISWQLAIGSPVKLTIFNIDGQKVATLVNERQTAGAHSVEWNASGRASGVYFYKLEAGEYVQVRKMILMK